ncbi:MAG TPA: type II toxin-antitoxin system VapC family toxin [Gaiella sp.]|nr:type II toxin-antitoxin system VapC family toxin [Gaiella sp.]
MRRLLLDTNVALWLLLGQRTRVSATAVGVLSDERNEIALSAASVWEIAIKRSLGKLIVEDGWSVALRRLGFDPMPVTALHAEAVEQLPWHHRDPFDRLLVAQALVEERVLVSADRRLEAYGVEVLW